MKNKLVIFLLSGLGLLVLPLLVQPFGDAWVRIIDIALLYVMLALGLNIVVGYAGLLDLGYVAFYAVGAYMFGLLASPHLWESFPWIKAMFPGGLFAAFQGFISPESFNLWESILVLCMIVLGGMGNIPGVILGAILLTVIPEALRYLGDLQRATLGHVVVDPSDLRMLLFGVALVAMMLYRPSGLLPSRVRRREFAAKDGVAEQEQADLYDAKA